MEEYLPVWLEPFSEPVGDLIDHGNGAIGFEYRKGYLENDAAIPVSQSLALQSGTYGDPETRGYFANLLQENNQLDDVIEKYGLSRADVFGILNYLGKDCPGAISCVPIGSTPVKQPGDLASDYEPLSRSELEKIVETLSATGMLPRESADPSPVAGYQPKLAVTVLGPDSWGLPKEGTGAPTTHILKVPRTNDNKEAKLEDSCMKLASLSGIPAASTTAYTIGEIPALLVKRFDRKVVDQKVYRIHQEDFLQALGLGSRLKYEREGQVGRRFNAQEIANILGTVRIPAKDKEAMILLTVFNLLIGNADNHAKNHALIYDAGRTPKLAPAYDLLSTKLNPDVNGDFSFRIGAATNIDELSKVDFFDFLALMGIRGRGAEEFVSDKVMKLIKKTDSLAESIESKNLKDHINTVAWTLVDVLELEGLDLANRDTFISMSMAYRIQS